MLVTQDLTLDVNQVSMFSYINAKQGDSGRRLRIRITVDGTPIDVPSGATVNLRAVKPDDTFIYRNGMVLSDGRIQVRITSQTFAVPGKVFVDIEVIHADTTTPFTTSTVTFVIYVKEAPMDTQAISSSNDFAALTSLVNGLSDYDNQLVLIDNNKANGPGITVDLEDDILTVTEVS